jgi:hypothetical protein
MQRFAYTSGSGMFTVMTMSTMVLFVKGGSNARNTVIEGKPLHWG